MTRHVARLLLLFLVFTMQAQAFSLDDWSRAITQEQNQPRVTQRQKLIFFYLSTCGFCHRIEPILQEVAHDAKIELVYVSGDGLPLAGNHQFITDDNLVRQFSVSAFPSVFLLDPQSHEAYAIAQGFTPRDVLTERIAQAATVLEKSHA